MTGKKKPTPQQKRQQVVDASGWTHIVKGRPSNSRTQHSILASHQRSSSLDTSFTLETYLSKFRNHYFPRWRESSCFKGLERIFEENISVLRGGITITDCVCLGLGSMTSGLETPSFELAALMDMLEILGEKHTIREVIFQDPIFDALDHAVLASLGYTVLEDPEAFSKISNQTFVFAPHLEFGAYATALEGAMPALCIGNDMDEYLNAPANSKEEADRKTCVEVFGRFTGQTISKPMPEFDRTPWCTSQRIYWAKPEDGDCGIGDVSAILDASSSSHLEQ